VSAVGIACLVVAVACLAVGLAALRELRRRLELMGRAEHELRGPATALALACEQIRRDPAAARHADVLDAQLERLRAGLADLGAARRGRRAAGGPLSQVELAPFVRAALEPWRAALRRCSLDWRAGPATALTDRRRLAQAVGNLMANSAEHGAGELDLRARRMPGGIRLEFRNRNRKLMRTPGEGDRGAAGTNRPGRGNGLAIASQAARDLGGRLLVDVHAAGTLAVLELPERPASDRAARASGEGPEPASRASDGARRASENSPEPASRASEGARRASADGLEAASRASDGARRASADGPERASRASDGAHRATADGSEPASRVSDGAHPASGDDPESARGASGPSGALGPPGAFGPDLAA
jgi:hypothetical protein